ncbi:hypothetical protein P8452_08570 [Trifolium repens]|nr:hypothetical protein QL285_051501 [Trifolium repens]WJX18807.1 hypothetical protein P8452_08570 [Trifolium repens]
MDIGRVENSSIEKTTCSECNGFGGTCRGGIVLLLNDVQRMFHEWNHESLNDVFECCVLRLRPCIRKRSREPLRKTSKDLWNPCDSEDIEHKRNEASFKLGKDRLNHHHDCRLFTDKLRN